MEARHKHEYEAWEKANPDSDAEKDTTVLSTTSGLYDLKIGTEDEKPITQVAFQTSWNFTMKICISELSCSIPCITSLEILY